MMTEPTIEEEPVPKIPSFLSSCVHDYSQKLLTGASVWALTHGASQLLDVVSVVTGKSDSTLISAAIQVGVGAAGLAASCAWTFCAVYLREHLMQVLKDFVPSDK